MKNEKLLTALEGLDTERTRELAEAGLVELVRFTEEKILAIATLKRMVLAGNKDMEKSLRTAIKTYERWHLNSLTKYGVPESLYEEAFKEAVKTGNVDGDYFSRQESSQEGGSRIIQSSPTIKMKNEQSKGYRARINKRGKEEAKIVSSVYNLFIQDTDSFVLKRWMYKGCKPVGVSIGYLFGVGFEISEIVSEISEKRPKTLEAEVQD